MFTSVKNMGYLARFARRIVRVIIMGLGFADPFDNGWRYDDNLLRCWRCNSCHFKAIEYRPKSWLRKKLEIITDKPMDATNQPGVGGRTFGICARCGSKTRSRIAQGIALVTTKENGKNQ